MSETGMRAYEELADIEIPKEQEEMMNIICDAWQECKEGNCKECPDRPHKYMRVMACTALKYTRWILENGYKKQTEGHWMTYHRTNGGRSQRGRTIIYKTFTCDACGKSNGRRKTPFCPYCGAKMKGGAE